MKKFALFVVLFCFFSCSSEKEIKGEVFIATQGGQNLKIGAIQVFLYKASAAELNNLTYDKILKGPLPIATTTTDSEGKFNFKVPAGEYAVVASSSRRILNDNEIYKWMVPANVRNGNLVLSLNNQNMEKGE